jgi:subtilase family serine protease
LINPARPGRRLPQRAAAVMATTLTLAAAGLAACTRSGPGPAGPAVMPPRLGPCRAGGGMPCYARDTLHRIYGLGQLYAWGITGAGVTAAVVDDGANPWVGTDLAAFDRFFRLPAARLRVLAWGDGAPGRVDPAAAREDIGDLELIHFIAPGARLLYVQVPPRAGLAGVTAATRALGAVSARQHVGVVSLSWGIPETAIPRTALPALRAGLASAARHQVSVIAATGDSGPTWPGLGRRTVAWPASGPLVTAVGAAVPQVGPGGRRAGPGTVAGGSDATGAGLSALFPRPAYQDTVARVVGDHRGVADVLMDCAMWVYARIPHHTDAPGWFPVCATSVAAPLFAGIIALAAQRAGHPLGLLNPQLYRLHGPDDGIADITHGTNTTRGVPGFAAGPGYDLPSGTGTVAGAPAFTAALIRPPARPGSTARQ